LYKREDRSAYYRLNQAIHLEIVRVTDNPVLPSAFLALHTKIVRTRALANFDHTLT
jgi:DNA-binding GntR family transcriptional regulator